VGRASGRLRVRRVDPDDRLSIVEHLTELRVRLFVSVVALVVAFAVLYVFHAWLLDVLLDPIAPEYRRLLALSPTEPFMVILKVVFGAAVLVALPVLLYQLYAFVVPAIANQARHRMLLMVAGVSLLFLAGVAFVYFLVLPVALEWLLGFAGDEFDVALRANEYFSFALTLMFAGGLLFEVPVAMLVLARLGLVSAAQFRGGWRVAIVVIAVLAAILPGGDPVSMLLLMVPQIVLYALGIWLAQVFGRPAPWAASAEAAPGPRETRA
jgi:sec-independent protein translocase protein TatC